MLAAAATTKAKAEPVVEERNDEKNKGSAISKYATVRPLGFFMNGNVGYTEVSAVKGSVSEAIAHRPKTTRYTSRMPLVEEPRRKSILVSNVNIAREPTRANRDTSVSAFGAIRK